MLIAIYCIYIYKYISELKPHWNNFRQPQKSYNSTSTYKKLNFSIYNKKVSSINKPTYITQALHGHIHKLTSWGIPMTADTCELWFGWAGTSSFPGKHLETRKRSGNGHPKRVSRHVHCVGCLFFFFEVHNVAQQIVWQQPRNIPIRRDWETFKMKLRFQDVSVSESFVSLTFSAESFHDLTVGMNFC